MLLVHTGWFICVIIAALCTLVGPIVAIIIAKQKLRVPWRYFLFGALIFLLFQAVSRIPLITVLTPYVAKMIDASPLLFPLWGVFLALTAGLFEEWGRYIGYRWLLKRAPKTWNTGVAYGLGHASIEAILLVGFSLTAVVIEVLVFSFTPIPAAQQATVSQVIKTFTEQPDWYQLMAVWERIWTMIFHVAMSVLVLQNLRQKSLRFVWLAVLFHTIIDTCAVMFPHYIEGVTGLFIVEIIVFIAGLLAFWWLRRSHQRMREEDAANEASANSDPLLSTASE